MKTIIDEHLWQVGVRGFNHETDAAIYLTASREDRMSNPLDPVRAAFDKAVGPHRKRQVLIDELKEPDVGKERRAQMVEESGQLREEWLSALIELRKAIDQCPVLRERLDK